MDAQKHGCTEKAGSSGCTEKGRKTKLLLHCSYGDGYGDEVQTLQTERVELQWFRDPEGAGQDARDEAGDWASGELLEPTCELENSACSVQISQEEWQPDCCDVHRQQA